MVLSYKKISFGLDIMKTLFFMVGVVKPWQRLPRDLLRASSLETFKVSLGWALSNLINLKMSLLISGELDQMTLKVPSKTFCGLQPLGHSHLCPSHEIFNKHSLDRTGCGHDTKTSVVRGISHLFFAVLSLVIQWEHRKHSCMSHLYLSELYSFWQPFRTQPPNAPGQETPLSPHHLYSVKQ